MRGVCLFGGHHRGYPRSAVIVSGLRRIGMPVTECTVSPRLKSPRRYPALVRAYRRSRGDFDVIFVPEFRHKDVPLAWSLSRLGGKLCVFDPLVSRYDTRVHDRGDASVHGMQAWHNLNLDRVSLTLPDLSLADTMSHARYFREHLAAPDARVKVLPVGYDDEMFKPTPQPHNGDTVRVLFYGSYLPLHGVDIIAEAAILLRGQRGIHFELIGGGQTFTTVTRRLRDAGVENVSVEPRMDASQLPGRIARASICLGIFGTTPKAARVVPNKVYQCMGSARAVISADSTAMREFFDPGRHVELVPAGNAEALAERIVSLASSDERRAALGDAAAAHVAAHFSPIPIARRFVALCEEAMES
jgi:glycosyltransferase involved in cell wall biosynthesis